MASSQSQIIAKVREVEALARVKFPGYLVRPLRVVFFPKGVRAGHANYSKHEVGFNLSQMVQDDHIINNTVPHEVAHIVAYTVFGDRGHGHNWTRVCRALGGNGERCYNSATRGITVVKAKRTREYLYRDSIGCDVWIGPVHHGKLAKKGWMGYALKTPRGTRIAHTGYVGQNRIRA